MPYSGVPSRYTQKLDDCVKDVMSRSSFDRTYRKRKTRKMSRKQLAIAICRSSMKI